MERTPDQLDHFNRLIKTAELVNREIEIVKRAAEIANNIGSFHARRLLSRARDDLEDALLKIRESQRKLADNPSDERGDDDAN
jgi:hypothetical protein